MVPEAKVAEAAAALRQFDQDRIVVPIHPDLLVRLGPDDALGFGQRSRLSSGPIMSVWNFVLFG